MKISAIVVTLNEEKRLGDCLQSLKRLEDIIVADIGSTDHSVEIAQDMGVKVISHPWVPIGEMVLANTMPLVRNDWVIRVDPDEVLPPDLLEDITQLDVGENIGIIQVPYQYYFLNKKLDTTIWGGVRSIPRIINRTRTTITSDVHRALSCRPGHESYILPSRPGNAVIHYWVDSYSQLITKHERYIAMEGESRYNNGFRFAWKSLLSSTLMSFISSFIKHSGWRGGWAGWFLSFFGAFYETRALLSLRHYEKLMPKNTHHQ
jgi:glycosyltransferase involved in cell wall biosynthesis